MTRVVAPSRLHFGLLHASRRFGGCGLMIDAPGVAVTVEPAAEWSGSGSNHERAVGFAKAVTARPHRVVVERCPPEHVGLGVGTSLGLAVAKALHPDRPTAELAQLVGRGRRSGVGLHGFDLGGFIVDAGKYDATALPRLASRHSFPAAWRVVLMLPDAPAVWHGPAETAEFARLRDGNVDDRTIDRMEYLLSRELVPAVEAGDYERFAVAVGEYNRLAGEPFARAQGGVYAGAIVSSLVEAVVGLGFPGVGQSSWGPTVFAVTPDADRAESLSRAIRGSFAGLRSVEMATPAAHGAVVTPT